MKNEKVNLINYRLDKAYTTLKEAELMIAENLFNDGVNRLYYSCFYAVIALLLTKDTHAKTHKGVRNLFQIHFIESGLLSRDLSKFYAELFNARQKSDYEDFNNYEHIAVANWLSQTKVFLKTVKALTLSLAK